MQILIKEYREGSKEESMKHIINAAYEATLKKYHGFIVKKVFSVRTVSFAKNFISFYFLALKHNYQIIASFFSSTNTGNKKVDNFKQ